MKNTREKTHLINEDRDLRLAVDALRGAREIALDTEADSMHAYPEKVCLLQIRSNEDSWLVDPLADLDFSDLMSLLSEVPLIFHAADYDLRLLFRRYGFRPCRIFDTMWAARMAGHERFGLEFLVKHYFDIQLEKASQTANWAIRPLTEAMAHYALDDVLHLKPLADQLRKELKQLNRLDWVEEICDRVIDQSCVLDEEDPDLIWRLKGSNKLTRRGLMFQKAIWHWREKEAVQANRPPFFILTHELTVRIAASAANNEDWSALIPKRMSPRRRHSLERTLRQTNQADASDFPHRLRPKRFRATDAEKQRSEDLKNVRDAAAERLKLDPSIIASRATLTRLGLKDSPATGELMQWQKELLGLA